MTHDYNFSIASGKRIINRNTDKRVSENASKELLEILEEVGDRVASQASKQADHAGRATIHDSDIRMAVREELNF